ncbi:MAG TPA: metallophosphoesterase [Candidatus Hydrogenedentes bacterium]|nr:metallophosphoesterase [Candidatus Hydrogenedentota bacterium]
MPEKPLEPDPARSEGSAASARTPLAVRAGHAGERRKKKEKYIRGLGVGKDETAPAGFVFTALVYAIRFTLMSLGLYRRGMQNARNLRLERRDIFFTNLPAALDGFRILHISDFHFPRRFPKFAAAVGELLRAVEVDLCVVTGDYRYGYFGADDHVAEHLKTALAHVKSRHGVYAVLGNHDHFVTGEMIEEAGFSVLYNEGVLIKTDGGPLWLCGIDEPHYYKCDDLDAAVRGRPDGAFTILLAHSPERVRQAAEKGVSLYLAGHTHGGQIRFPIIGALVSNARCPRNQVWGRWRHKDMIGHTTAGIGATDVPVRYNCPPEAALLTLRRDTTAEQQETPQKAVERD